MTAPDASDERFGLEEGAGTRTEDMAGEIPAPCFAGFRIDPGSTPVAEGYVQQA